MKSDYLSYIDSENLIQYLPVVNMSDHDKDIVRIYVSHHITYHDFGLQYGLSRERIRQVLTRFAQKAHHYYKKDLLKESGKE